MKRLSAISCTSKLTAVRAFLALCTAICFFQLTGLCAPASAHTISSQSRDGQSTGALTPLQRQIEKERKRLASTDTEERRDAVVRLGAMGRPESSRAAVPALSDREAIVRATAARAVVSLGPNDSTALLTPLLRDRNEFVRREAAYALGSTKSRAAAPALIDVLEKDKQPSVRGAAAVALGQIADASAVAPLTGKLSERKIASGFINRITRRKREEDEFVRRSAAVSLGQIGSRDAVPALIEVLADERSPDDLRREAACALGAIGDPAAIPTLRSALVARDPHLSVIAQEALRKLETPRAESPTQKQNGR